MADFEVELSKLSADLGPDDGALPDLDVLQEITKELDERPNPTRVTSARPRRTPVPGMPGEMKPLGGEPRPPSSGAAPLPPSGAPTSRRPPPKEDDLSAEVQPSAEGDQVFEVHDGQAQARVSDRLETRAAFLYYTASNYKPNEMHRMTFNVPYLKREQMLNMCHDLDLLEPKGPLSKMALGIMFATNVGESETGLSYAAFLDVLLELAFETGTNVAGVLAAGHAKREQAQLLTKQTMRLSSQANGLSETGLLRASMRSSQSGSPSILRGFSESGFKNTGRSDGSICQPGPPMLSTNASFRSRFSDCGKTFLDAPAGNGRSCSVGKTGRLHNLSELEPDVPSGNTWGRFNDGDQDGIMPRTPHPPNGAGRTRAATREARKLRPSMSGAVNPYSTINPDGTLVTAAPAAEIVNPLHAAVLRSPAANVSPTSTLGRSPSASRSRFSKCGGADPDWPGGIVSPTGPSLPADHDGASSPLTWSTDTSLNSPSSGGILSKLPVSRPSSGIKSPQTVLLRPRSGAVHAAAPAAAAAAAVGTA